MISRQKHRGDLNPQPLTKTECDLQSDQFLVSGLRLQDHERRWFDRNFDFLRTFSLLIFLQPTSSDFTVFVKSRGSAPIVGRLAKTGLRLRRWSCGRGRRSGWGRGAGGGEPRARIRRRGRERQKPRKRTGPRPE